MNDYDSSAFKKPERRKKSGRILLFLAAVFVFSLLVAGGAALFDEYMGKTKGGEGWLFRTKDVISTFLGQKPHFYHLVVERNGADERITEDNVFVLTYRDEFVIKEATTSSPFSRGITVDVEGAGGDSDLRVLLKGVELVDRVVREKAAAPSKTERVYAYGIAVKFKGEEIARIPVQVEVSPQDWLRFAKASESQRSQIQYLERAVAESKDDVNLRKALAAAHVKAGNVDRAIREYRTVLAAKPGDAVALAELSRCYLAKKDYLQAQETAQRLVKVKPKDAGAYAIIALAYGKQKKWDRAIANYQESLKWNPDDVNVLMNLGEAYEMVGKNQGAIEQYKKALQKNPQDKTIKAALADAYKRSGDHQAAIKLYSEVITEKPREAGARKALGPAQGAKGNWKEEIEEYKKALKAKPDDPVTRYNLALAYEKGKMYREAASEYEKVLTVKPNDAEALSRLSNIYFQEKRYRDAVLFLNKLKKLAPKNATVYAHTGFAYGEMKQYKEASWNYAKAIELGSKDPQVRYNLATVYGKMGREKDAIREYEKFAAVSPNTEVLTILGEYYVKTKNYDGAIKAYKKLTVMEGGKAAGYSGLGLVYDLKGQTDQAIENYRTALKHNKKDEKIYLQLARAYEKKGRNGEAMEAYTSAYNINPDSGEAADGITRLKISEIQKKHKE